MVRYKNRWGFVPRAKLSDPDPDPHHCLPASKPPQKAACSSGGPGTETPCTSEDDCNDGDVCSDDGTCEACSEDGCGEDSPCTGKKSDDPEQCGQCATGECDGQSPPCGNGVLDAGEQCDAGADNGIEACACSADCRMAGLCTDDVSKCCTSDTECQGGTCCGDGVISSPEQCDGSNDAQCPGQCIGRGQTGQCTCPQPPVITGFTCRGSSSCTVNVCEDAGLEFTFSDANGDASSWTVTGVRDDGNPLEPRSGPIDPDGGSVGYAFLSFVCLGCPNYCSCFIGTCCGNISCHEDTFDVVLRLVDQTGLQSNEMHVTITVPANSCACSGASFSSSRASSEGIILAPLAAP